MNSFIVDWIGGSKEQRECLYYAAKNNNANMLDYLLKNVNLSSQVKEKSAENDYKTLLHIAAEKGNDRIIFELAGDEPGYGVDVNAVDRNGNTPLHLAAFQSEDSSARFLLSLGADMEARNLKGETPLHMAVKARNLRTTKDMLLKGAERDVRDNQGMYPIDLTAEIEDKKLRKAFNRALVSKSSDVIQNKI